ncbi:chaplin [Streptomyces sp. PA5.6]|uniref:chaplin n=1 Tax=Streptomyces sp. PA5.6 TaxID=3035651 RepID=UPI003904DB72
MRIRTAAATTVLAALTVLGGAGVASADGHDGNDGVGYGIESGSDINTVHVENTAAVFGDLVMD